MKAGHFERSDAPFTPDELEFFAEEDKITILPKISTKELSNDGRPGYLQLLSGELVSSSLILSSHVSLSRYSGKK